MERRNQGCNAVGRGGPATNVTVRTTANGLIVVAASVGIDWDISPNIAVRETTEGRLSGTAGVPSLNRPSIRRQRYHCSLQQDRRCCGGNDAGLQLIRVTNPTEGTSASSWLHTSQGAKTTAIGDSVWGASTYCGLYQGPNPTR